MEVNIQQDALELVVADPNVQCNIVGIDSPVGIGQDNVSSREYPIVDHHTGTGTPGCADQEAPSGHAGRQSALQRQV